MTDPTQDPGNNNAADATPEDDWAAALAEQSAGSRTTQADGLQAMAGQAPEVDDWAAALAEQTAATAKPTPAAAPAAPAAAPVAPAAPAATPAVFQPLVNQGADATSDIDMIMDIPVQLSVELGRTRLTIKNILQLGQGSVVELDGLAGEPMDIYVNGYLIAQGEVVVVDEKYGIRVTDIITPSDRISRLNSRR